MGRRNLPVRPVEEPGFFASSGSGTAGPADAARATSSELPSGLRRRVARAYAWLE